MLIYERIDDSEGIDLDKTDKSKECMICYYWFLQEKNFNFEKLICNVCQLKKKICCNFLSLLFFLLCKR